MMGPSRTTAEWGHRPWRRSNEIASFNILDKNSTKWSGAR